MKHEIRIIVCTCNKYDFLLPGMARQFNRYWGSGEVTVHVLGSRIPPPLPSNFVFHSVGPDSMDWTTGKAKWVESQDDTPFVLLLEDYWITEKIDLCEVEEMARWVTERGAVKADLSTNTHHFAHNTLVRDGRIFCRAKPTALYRTSTQPAIWTKQYFLNLCQPGMTAWEFELQNNPAVREGDIIGTDRQIVTFANVMYKGLPAGYEIEKLNQNDFEELKRHGEMNWTGMQTCIAGMKGAVI